MKGAIRESDAEDRFQRVLTASNCSDVACLKAMDAEQIVSVSAHVEDMDDISVAWAPVVDGKGLKRLPTELIELGEYNIEASVIVGSNRDDGSLFLLNGEAGNFTNDLDEDDFDAIIQYDDFNFGGYHSYQPFNDTTVAYIKELYDLNGEYQYPDQRGKYSDNWWKIMRAETDRVWGLGACAVRRLARLMASVRLISIHLY